MKVTVHKFRCLVDKAKGRWEVQPEMATREWINEQKDCQIVLNSARDVDESELNANGFYVPKT